MVIEKRKMNKTHAISAPKEKKHIYSGQIRIFLDSSEKVLIRQAPAGVPWHQEQQWESHNNQMLSRLPYNGRIISFHALLNYERTQGLRGRERCTPCRELSMEEDGEPGYGILPIMPGALFHCSCEINRYCLSILPHVSFQTKSAAMYRRY